MKTNTPRPPNPIKTHEGGPAARITATAQLRRSVMACLLWEKEFYEDGQDIAARIAEEIKLVPADDVAAIAIEAREKMKLRHAPLFIVREMARLETHRHLVATILARVIQRADELSEFVSLYWKDKRQPLSAQVKKGLAAAFLKFDAYALAKYNRAGTVLLRDVLFLCHAKADTPERDAMWKQLIADELPVPDTWETALSGKGDTKLATWTRLLNEDKLGGLALLRNLRNMTEASVEPDLIRVALAKMRTDRILPFRFIAAARVVPRLEDALEPAMFRCLSDAAKLSGHTVLLVDVSSSMDAALSGKSDLSRADAAYALAMLLREICERVSVFSFSMKFCEIAPRRGFALRDAIHGSQEHGGTPLGTAVQAIYADRNWSVSQAAMTTTIGTQHPYPVEGYRGQGLKPDRLIVITDEQSANRVPDPAHGRGYMVNVASAKNGVGYGKWTHVDGFSEAIVEYIVQSEHATPH